MFSPRSHEDLVIDLHWWSRTNISNSDQVLLAGSYMFVTGDQQETVKNWIEI